MNMRASSEGFLPSTRSHVHGIGKKRHDVATLIFAIFRPVQRTEGVRDFVRAQPRPVGHHDFGWKDAEGVAAAAGSIPGSSEAARPAQPARDERRQADRQLGVEQGEEREAGEKVERQRGGKSHPGRGFRSGRLRISGAEKRDIRERRHFPESADAGRSGRRVQHHPVAEEDEADSGRPQFGVAVSAGLEAGTSALQPGRLRQSNLATEKVPFEAFNEYK